MRLKTLFILLLVSIPILLVSQIGFLQNDVINCGNSDGTINQEKLANAQVNFSIRPIKVIQIAGSGTDSEYVSIELNSEVELDSVKILVRNLTTSIFEEYTMLDNGLNGDLQANDNIYTSSSPILLSYNVGVIVGEKFGTFRNSVKIHFYLQGGETEKYSSTLKIYYFTSEGYDQFQNYKTANPVVQQNDSIFYSSNIIHIVSKNKHYSTSTIDYLTFNFKDLDQLMGEDYNNSDINIFYSYNDIDRESGGNSGSYSFLSNEMKVKSLSFSLLKHELLHEWVNQVYNFDLGPNNGHWGFVERSKSGFGVGCYHGVFQELSEDLDNGGVKGLNFNDSKRRQFSNLELFLMNRQPIDSVDFPLYFVNGNNLSCSSSYLENGVLDSLSKDEFIERYEDEQEIVPLTDFGDTINFHTILLYDQRLSDEIIQLLGYEIKQFENYLAEYSRNHLIGNTLIFKDSDFDGFSANVDCDDTNPDVNPNQIEEPYNGLDDDCDETTLDDDLDQDGFLQIDDCDDNNSNINPGLSEVPYNGIDDDCDEETLDDDLDQDGYLLVDDCDDTNPNINSGQSEVPYNGIDDDCDEETLDDDLDQDGFLLADDCNDTDPNINPDAEEIANNGIDEDCDGMDLVTSTHELSNSEIKIYPNPVVDIVYIDVAGQLNYQVSLFDLNGKLVKTSNNTKTLEIDVFPQGTYLLEIKDVKTGHSVVERIVVSK